MLSRDFAPGTFVLVWNNPLDFQFRNKGALHWQGPYIIVQHHLKGAYVLTELDRTVLMKPFAACHLKLYHYRDSKDPIIAIEWQNHVEEDYDILDEADEDAEDYKISSLVVHKVKMRRIPKGLKLPHPWELHGKQSDEYWQKVYDNWKSGETECRLASNILPDWENWDYHDVNIDDIPHWKMPPMNPQLFILWQLAACQSTRVFKSEYECKFYYGCWRQFSTSRST